VEFRADKVEKWFPIAINWSTKKVRKTEMNNCMENAIEVE